MAKRPAKAAEARPRLAFLPHNSDGTPIDVMEQWRRAHAGKPIGDQFLPVWMIGEFMLPEPKQSWPDELASFLQNCRIFMLPDTWHGQLALILETYRHARFSELVAPRETDVQEAIGRISKLSRELKRLLDLPQRHSRIYEAAWTRIAAARQPHDAGQNLHDLLYPGLSLLLSRLAALPKVARENPDAQPGSLTILVRELADYVRQHGGRASPSNGIARKKGDELSAFARLVKQAIIVANLPPPCAMTDSAISKAVQVALKKRGR